MIAVVDTCVLTLLCDNKKPDHLRAQRWFRAVIATNDVVLLPAIADYELRRGLLHSALSNGVSTSRALSRLDEAREVFGFLPLSEDIMARAAHLWAKARHQGRPTADKKALDGDVILAAQALSIQAGVITENRKHLSVYNCNVIDWRATPLP